jgi:hypothetical protein
VSSRFPVSRPHLKASRILTAAVFIQIAVCQIVLLVRSKTSIEMEVVGKSID